MYCVQSWSQFWFFSPWKTRHKKEEKTRRDMKWHDGEGQDKVRWRKCLTNWQMVSLKNSQALKKLKTTIHLRLHHFHPEVPGKRPWCEFCYKTHLGRKEKDRTKTFTLTESKNTNSGCVRVTLWKLSQQGFLKLLWRRKIDLHEEICCCICFLRCSNN